MFYLAIFNLYLTLVHIYSVSSLVVRKNDFKRKIIEGAKSWSKHMSITNENNNPEDISLLNEMIQYVDLSSPFKEGNSNSRSLPLFLLGGAFYPHGITYLNIFEMKYRTMMYDVANSDDMFGYIHSDPASGRIGQVGTLCKVIDRQLLEDGRQYVALSGIGRFRVSKILKTLPYVTGEVETDLTDDPVTDEDRAHRLELDTYNYLKYYMRLLRLFEGNRSIVVTQAAKKHRPRSLSILPQTSAKETADRRTNFSFALANMIQMSQVRESQLLLQTTDVEKRLRVEKHILSQAAELIAEQLVKGQKASPDEINSLRFRAFTEPEDDDILPNDAVEKDEKVEKDEWDISNIE